MPCTKCSNDYPIVNKKYGLCANCNSLRLHNQSLGERQAASASRFQQNAQERFRQKVKVEGDYTLSGTIGLITRKSIPVRVNNRIPVRQQTTGEAAVKRQLSVLKKEIELEAVQDNSYYCAGCGCSHVGLDKSHILSVGSFKHLELVKENIQLLCRSCHRIWESTNTKAKIHLHCFIDNMRIIKKHDEVMYNKNITRIEEYQVFVSDPEEIHFVSQLLHILKN